MKKVPPVLVVVCLVIAVAFVGAIWMGRRPQQQAPSDLVPLRGGDWTAVTSFEGKSGETILISAGELDQYGTLKASRITELFYIWADFYPVELELKEPGQLRYLIYLHYFHEELDPCTIIVYPDTVVINGQAFGGVNQTFLDMMEQRLDGLTQGAE